MDATLGKAINRTDSEERLVEIAKYVSDRGPYRKACPLPTSWRQTLVRVGAEMPNFRGAIDALQAECVLAERNGGPPNLPPFILVGPPGIGKSVFCEAIAGMFETTYRRVQWETTATSAGISGSSNYWGHTRPGLVFELLVGGDLANPVILIDEIDKGPAPTEHPGPFSSLYALWQEESARRFSDSCLPEIHFDASRVIWFATCNSLAPIPAPVLSRAQVIHVDPPTRKDALMIVFRIYAEVVAGAGVEFRPLGEALAETLARQSPRAIKRILRSAVGRALLGERDHLLASDIRKLCSP
jgi:ATP-dependent Lon protease